MIKMPLCGECKNELELSVSFTGCYWNCEAKDPKFCYELHLQCNNCGKVYLIGMVKNEKDFSFPI